MSAADHLWLRILAVLLAALAVALALSSRQSHSLDARLADDAVEAMVPYPAVSATSLRPLFAPNTDLAVGATSADSAQLADGPPEMIGVAGRLPDDIEVLVRMPDGSSATLRQGQVAAGWVLVSAAIDRAVFERAGERRVAVLKAP